MSEFLAEFGEQEAEVVGEPVVGVLESTRHGASQLLDTYRRYDTVPDDDTADLVGQGRALLDQLGADAISPGAAAPRPP